MGLTLYNRVAGNTQEQSQAQAQKMVDLMANQIMQVDVECPGNVNVDPTWILQLNGTQTVFDMSYYIQSVTHEFDFESGYRMTVEARNEPGGGSGSGVSFGGE